MLSENVKEFRCKKGLSKADLARISGVSYRTIEFIEKGKIDNPTLKTLKALSMSLEVSVEELIGEE